MTTQRLFSRFPAPVILNTICAADTNARWPLPTPGDRLSPDALRDGPLPRPSVLREPGQRARRCGVLTDEMSRMRVAWWEVVNGRAEWRECWVAAAWVEARE